MVLVYGNTMVQFHRAAKQPIVCLLYVFHFIALLTVKHRERHANLFNARKLLTQQYKSMVNAPAALSIFLLTHGWVEAFRGRGLMDKPTRNILVFIESVFVCPLVYIWFLVLISILFGVIICFFVI